jgi:hypothetical protein
VTLTPVSAPNVPPEQKINALVDTPAKMELMMAPLEHVKQMDARLIRIVMDSQTTAILNSSSAQHLTHVKKIPTVQKLNTVTKMLKFALHVRLGKVNVL